jgi:hypothetical protein
MFNFILTVTSLFLIITQIDNLTVDHSQRSFSILQKLIENKNEGLNHHWLERKNTAESENFESILLKSDEVTFYN